MFLPHPGDFTYCFLWRLNQKTVLPLAILPVLIVSAVKRAEEMSSENQTRPHFINICVLC